MRQQQRRCGSRCCVPCVPHGDPQAEPVVTRLPVASGDGARLPPSFSQSWSSVLCACFSLWRLRRSREAKTAPPQAANNLAQRMSIFMITSIQSQEWAAQAASGRGVSDLVIACAASPYVLLGANPSKMQVAAGRKFTQPRRSRVVARIDSWSR